MYERFSDRARKVMQLANQEALRLNNEYVGSQHVLLALAREGSGVAAHALKNLGVTLDRLRGRFQPSPGPLVQMRKLPLTPGAKKAVEGAVAEAQALGHNYIGTEHLLLGLVRPGDPGEEQSGAERALRALGVTPAAVRGEVDGLLGTRPPEETAQAVPHAFEFTSISVDPGLRLDAQGRVWRLQVPQEEKTVPGPQADAPAFKFALGDVLCHRLALCEPVPDDTLRLCVIDRSTDVFRDPDTCKRRCEGHGPYYLCRCGNRPDGLVLEPEVFCESELAPWPEYVARRAAQAADYAAAVTAASERLVEAIDRQAAGPEGPRP